MFNARQQCTGTQIRKNTFGSCVPFIGHNEPFIGLGTQQSRPLIQRKLPFVRDQGFTLVELMITLAILAIVGSFAMPAFRDTILNTRIKTASNDLIGIMQIARSESIKRKRPITVCVRVPNTTTCSAKTNWSDGLVMWIDTNSDGVVDGGEEVLRQTEEIQRGITIITFAALAQLSFLPDGTSTAPVNTEFRVCDNERINEKGRSITIGFTGRPKSSEYTCI